MVVRELVRLAKDKLKDIDGAVREAYSIVCHALECSKNDIIMYSDSPVSMEGYVKTLALIDSRLSGIPTAYITGTCEFMSLPFVVDERVLVPRSDTETLAEAVIHDYRGKISKGMDLCTGSGCIAVSLATYMPECTIDALDISTGAVTVAKRNAELNGVNNRVRVIEADLFSLEAESYNGFDFIVSNPPYIRTDIIDTLSAEVQHEPLLALDGGTDGLRFYRSIAEKAALMLKDGGKLYVEIGYDQAEDVSALFSQNRFKDIHVIQDLLKNNRVVTAVWQS